MSDIGTLLSWTVFSIGDTATSVRDLLEGVAALVLTYLVSRMVQRIVTRKSRALDDNEDSTRTYGIIAVMVIWLVGIEVAFDLLGFDLTTLLAASGFLALGAGFAVKNIVENFLSGGILRIERTIRPGDVIIVDGRYVIIRKIALRTTRADTCDGEQILIPNSTVAQSMVTNLTRRDRFFRIHVEVGVAYESDLNQVRSVLEKTVDALEWVSQERKSAIYLVEFGDSSVNYKVSVWIDDLRDSRRCTSELNEAIWQALADNKITIALPQLDVHLDGSAEKKRSR